MKIAIGIDVHMEKCAACAVYAGTDEPSKKNLEYLEKFKRTSGDSLRTQRE